MNLPAGKISHAEGVYRPQSGYRFFRRRREDPSAATLDDSRIRFLRRQKRKKTLE